MKKTVVKKIVRGYKTCKNCGMLNVPSADVQPIVYAHKTINVGMRSYCSNCGELAIMENFCSKCGAKVERRKQNG